MPFIHHRLIQRLCKQDLIITNICKRRIVQQRLFNFKKLEGIKGDIFFINALEKLEAYIYKYLKKYKYG